MRVTSWTLSSVTSSVCASLVSAVELVGGGAAAGLVTGRLGLRLGDEQVDLAELAIEARDLLGQPGGQLREAGRGGGRRGGGCVGHRSGSRGRRWGRDGDQSSGIRIQPWRIAYTTAWVRSLTDSLRRIELMWFLTVCSLIDSA